MAKLPRTGIAYQCLDEREVTLAEIVVGLGLKPLSKKAEREIRNRLGFALATWDEPYAVLQDCPSSEFLGQRTVSFKGGSGSSGC